MTDKTAAFIAAQRAVAAQPETPRPAPTAESLAHLAKVAAALTLPEGPAPVTIKLTPEELRERERRERAEFLNQAGRGE
ncbi:MAG: hypothetical protein Q8M24_08380 [Pseudolabrys sp.]|nr:hypothetical protein [Pseudolabrys sp.]MDP2295463.1 hypothetical protein [Pseudolabrys sp.]